MSKEEFRVDLRKLTAEEIQTLRVKIANMVARDKTINRKCCICGKTILGFEKLELVKTKRKYYICFHRECYDKLPKVKGSAVME